MALKNTNKKQFKNYDFSNIQKTIQTLKVKEFAYPEIYLSFFRSI